jgi:tetratricopeptide (TPR) repeat protein
MKIVFHSLLIYLLLGCASFLAAAQTGAGQLSSQDQAVIEKAFHDGNELMDKRKYAEALARYREGLIKAPEEPSLLFNGGMAAYLSKDFARAVEMWKKLKVVLPDDWQTRAKLIQAYQATGDLKARDAERQSLLGMRKQGKNEELSQQEFYCREQFEAGGKKLMAFEHFELKGERALRYVFTVMNEKGDGEEFRISLGSYNTTNSIAVETGQVKKSERLFHLDGYYPERHATFGFFTPEPSYDEVRKAVVSILEKKTEPQSQSLVNPSAKKP